MAERVDWISVLLNVLALPVHLVRGALRVRRDLRRLHAAGRGVVRCSSGHETTLTRMAQCPVCRAVKPMSVLVCAVCKTTFDAVTCAVCDETILL